MSSLRRTLSRVLSHISDLALIRTYNDLLWPAVPLSVETLSELAGFRLMAWSGIRSNFPDGSILIVGRSRESRHGPFGCRPRSQQHENLGSKPSAVRVLICELHNQLRYKRRGLRAAFRPDAAYRPGCHHSRLALGILRHRCKNWKRCLGGRTEIVKGLDDRGDDLRISLRLEELDQGLNRLFCRGADLSEAGGGIDPDELVRIVQLPTILSRSGTASFASFPITPSDWAAAIRVAEA